MKKEIKLRNEIVIAKFNQMMLRFGYSTSTHFIEDMITFFENNAVNPKQTFTSLINDLHNQIEAFNKDNNRVIAILRNIEKAKIDTIYRILTTEVTDDLRFVKSKFSLNEVAINNQKNSEVQQQNISNDSLEKLKEDYEKKLKSERERYKLLQVEYDKITLEHGAFYNRLKKLSSLFSVEKSTFGKNKIVFEMSEDEFKELIKLR
jgi:hypothetical protein